MRRNQNLVDVTTWSEAYQRVVLESPSMMPTTRQLPQQLLNRPITGALTHDSPDALN